MVLNSQKIKFEQNFILFYLKNAFLFYIAENMLKNLKSGAEVEREMTMKEVLNEEEDD